MTDGRRTRTRGPRAPKGIPADLAEVWRQAVGPKTTPAGRVLVAEFLATIQRLRDVREAIQRDGLTTTDTRSGQIRPHPLLAVEAGLLRELRRLWDLIGLQMDYAPTVQELLGDCADDGDEECEK